MKRWGVLCMVWLGAAPVFGRQWWVDNPKGDDAGDGTKARPFKTIDKALASWSGSDEIHLVPTEVPYPAGVVIKPQTVRRDGKNVKVDPSGTAETPTVFDGHGATLSGLTAYPAKAWKDEGGGVFSKPLKNNAWFMDKHWHMGFDLVFFDGKAGVNSTSREALKPMGYFLLRYRRMNKDMPETVPNNNTLYIRLPEGKTPDDIEVKTVAPGPGLSVQHIEHYVIRNLTSMYTGRDGFSSTRAKHGRWENLRGCYNMDQGVSHHGSSSQVMVDCRFDRNTGCGIVDVYPECEITYRNCLVEDDLYRGGIEFHKGTYTMENCVIRHHTNVRNYLSVAKGATVTLTNCLIVGGPDKPRGTVINGGGGTLTMTGCTLYNLASGLTMWSAPKPKKKATLKMTHCAILDCPTIYNWRSLKKGVANLEVDYNLIDRTTTTVFGKNYEGKTFDSYIKDAGLDEHSIIGNYNAELPPYSPPAEGRGKGKGGADIGATIDPNHHYGPTEKAVGIPDGVE